VFILTLLESGTPRVYHLRDGEMIIGRSPSCDLVVAHPTVSRQHACVRVEGGRCFVRDAGSRFGTLLNQAPLTGEAELRPGDTFAIGQATIALEQHVAENELLSEEHQLLEDSGTLLRRVDLLGQGPGAQALPAPAPAPGAPAGPTDRETVSGAPAPAVAAATGGAAERRATRDRRQLDLGRAAGDRRSGIDRRGSGNRLRRLLSEIGKTLVTVQPLPQVLARVVDLAFDVVPAERVFLLLRESADEALSARVVRHRDGSAPQQVTLSRTVVNRVMRDRVSMLAADARYDARLDAAGSIQAMNIRSFMCAPLWNRNDVIGVLYCDNPRTQRFAAEDLEVFTALSNYAAVAIEQARLAAQLLEETQRRERLQRYHSPAVVNRILQAVSGDASFVAQERDVTVMFCDIVGFTTICERMEPADVAAVLNGFLTRMAEVIFEHEGTLDKFLGDALLAVFGAPFDQPDHAERAVSAALAMRRALASMNAEHPERQLRMRIALNSGRAMTGDIGSPRRREFTVLGDVVNPCARAEESVAQPDQIAITRETLERVNSPFNTRPLGTFNLRGRHAMTEVFEVAD